MKKSLFFIIFSCFTLASAQSDNSVENHMVTINFLTPGLEYELGIGNSSTLDFSLGTGFALRGASEQGVDFGAYPFLKGQYRYYYNMDRRLAKGKNIAGNTGNYFGINSLVQSGNPLIGDLSLSSEYIFQLGGMYGFQRTYRKGFNFGIEGGVGYFENDVDGGVYVVLDFSIGWVLGKKR